MLTTPQASCMCAFSLLFVSQPRVRLGDIGYRVDDRRETLLFSDEGPAS